MRKIKKIHIHHTQSPVSMFNGKNHVELKNMVYKWHVIERHFTDIGYHYLIFPDGEIKDCRPIYKKPASIKFHNKYALTYCLWGNFDTDTIIQKQYNSLISHVSMSLNIYELSVKDIIFHREINYKKTCPGKKFSKSDFIDNLITYRTLFGENI